jgi:hypothetical protein
MAGGSGGLRNLLLSLFDLRAGSDDSPALCER